jgi:four helix bundle protein
MHNYKELNVWQKSRELVKFIYFLTSKFPKEELFGISSQMRRAVISISSNIAEGSGHSSKKDFIRFLEISYSSTSELETQIILSFDLNYVIEIDLNQGLEKISEIQKMLSGLIKSLKK